MDEFSNWLLQKQALLLFFDLDAKSQIFTYVPEQKNLF